MVDPATYKNRVDKLMNSHVILSRANPADGISRKDFELEISFKAADDADHSVLLRRTIMLLEKNGVEVLQETERTIKRKPQPISGSSIRANWVVWRADGHVYVSLHRTTEDCKKNPVIRAYDGEWDIKSRRTRRNYLLPDDFTRGKIHEAEDLAYIKRRKKAVPPETASKVVPSDNRANDLGLIQKLISKLRGERNDLMAKRDGYLKAAAKLNDSIKLKAIEVNRQNKRLLDTIRLEREGLKKRKKEQDAPLQEKDDQIAILEAKLARMKKEKKDMATKLAEGDEASIERYDKMEEIVMNSPGFQDIDLDELPEADAELVVQ